jgi:sialate O-acetylesterase
MKDRLILLIVLCLATLSMTTLALGAKVKEDVSSPPKPGLEAQLALPFRDNAVLQQKLKLPVWGLSLPEAKVSVSFDDQSKSVRADAEGKWRVILDPMTAVPLKSVNDSPAGKAMTVVCEKDGKKAIKTINNLLVGDVWLCAGQSNMAGKLKRAGHIKNYPPNSVKDAHYPALRYFSPAKGTWLVCSPETVVEVSRVAFFFIRRVQREALVPMGVMVTAVGGSNIESWLNQSPYPTGKNYEKLVKPIVGYGIKGAVWYQGESNEADRRAYHPKLKSLILGWRKAWGQDDFPVHFVQLPGLNGSTLENPAGGDGRAEIRQAFVETLAVENTGMAVTIDVGTQGEHPPNKFDTGVRLARSVLKKVYGFEEISSCPLYKSHEVVGHTVRISFSDDAEKGLMIAKKADSLPDAFLPPVPELNAKLQWLAIQAKDGTWHWADGKIDGSGLIVSAKGVERPKAVRYAYTAQPLGNLLYNTDGMPVGPFTTCGYDISTLTPAASAAKK